jgi:4-hydroxyphenylacetate 3-monooxygenase
MNKKTTNAANEPSNQPAAARPMTGDEYLDSLKDGREVYIFGERVKDVTTHPAFRNSARMTARLYDALQNPAKNSQLAVPTDTGSGGITHPFFKAPKNADDLIKSRDAIAAWQRIGYGWQGRAPDYKASFIAAMGAMPEFFGEYESNARSWYKKTQESLLYWNHAIVNPPIDRNKGSSEIEDICVHVERETDAGIIVSGAKVVATNSALTHQNFVGLYGVPVKDPRFALIFTLPMNSPGLKIICRTSYEYAAAVMGTPFDYPLSSRMDENDSVLVLDKVLVPWENVFAYRDINTVNNFIFGSGFMSRALFHGCTRLAVKLDFITGLFIKATETTGANEFRGVQGRIGEVLAWRNLFWSLSEAMARNPEPWGKDSVQVNNEAASAYRVFAPMAYPMIKDLIEKDLGAALVYLPSHAADFLNPDTRPYLDRFVRGSNGIDAEQRVKVLKLLWDAIGTEFGSRHELYERNYAGNHEDNRIQTLGYATLTGKVDQLKDFVDSCLNEYDLNGWTAPDLINPTDTGLFGKK